MTPINYDLLDSQLRALLQDENDALASACNFVALLFHSLPDINWLGIYVRRGEELVLGPFQGKPACVHIALADGVCGAAATSLATQRVADVHTFPGHIVCDPDSRAELVVPLQASGELLGVLDIDSPSVARFSAADQAGIEMLCASFCELQNRKAAFI